MKYLWTLKAYSRLQETDLASDTSHQVELTANLGQAPKETDISHRQLDFKCDSTGDGSDNILSSSSLSATTQTSGWRYGAAIAAGLAGAILILNISTLIWLETLSAQDSGLVEVFHGDCTKTHSLNIWLHFIINVLSTLILGGSNYCMQCLSSPSRADINASHRQNKSLDIGVLSVRNLFAISKDKLVLWWLLAISSVPLHLVYNSVFFTAVAALDYDIYVVTPSFLQGNVSWNPTNFYTDDQPTDIIYAFNYTSPDLVYGNYSQFQRYRNLTVDECIQAYAQVVSSQWQNLLLVTNNPTTNYTVLHADMGQFSTYTPYQWICDSDPNIESKIDDPQFNPNTSYCEPYVSQIRQLSDVGDWMPYNHSIAYCMAEQAEQQCSFRGNIPVLGIVIACNVIKVVVMLLVAYKLPGTPLITIGDAIESFLEVPDETTRGLCWLTRIQATSRHPLALASLPNRSLPLSTYVRQGPQPLPLKRLRWFNATGRSRWLRTIVFMSAGVLVSLGLFVWGFKSIRNYAEIQLKDLGFGQLQPLAVITNWAFQNISSNAGQILAAVLVANMPQLILSFLYFNINGLMTNMWLADEWSGFATERKYLRVSSPKGQQRSTHFLQLPYKISGPLLVVSASLHWLVSQSIFLAVVAEYDPQGTLVNSTAVVSCGYSLIPMIVTMCVGVATLAGLIALGFRRYDGRIPLVGTCSIAISAACHRPEWDRFASIRRVKYGELPETRQGNAIGHCSFTSADVLHPIPDRLYS